MKIAAVRASHVAQLVGALSDVSAAEAHELGYSNWQVAHELRAAVVRGAGDAVSDARGLLFVMAHEPHPTEPAVRVTTFAATQRYFGMGASGVRLGGRYLANLRKRYPGVTFEAHTFSPHPEVDRWFTVLGFEKLAPGMFRLSTTARQSSTLPTSRA